MPGQMPQQMPPQGAPQGDAPQDPQGGGAQSSAIEQLFSNIDQAVDHAKDILSNAPGAPPQAKQLIAQIDQLMGNLMQVLGGSGDDESQEGGKPEAQGQTSPMEAGGNKGAIPAP